MAARVDNRQMKRQAHQSMGVEFGFNWDLDVFHQSVSTVQDEA